MCIYSTFSFVPQACMHTYVRMYVHTLSCDLLKMMYSEYSLIRPRLIRQTALSAIIFLNEFKCIAVVYT